MASRSQITVILVIITTLFFVVLISLSISMAAINLQATVQVVSQGLSVSVIVFAAFCIVGIIAMGLTGGKEINSPIATEKTQSA